MIKNITWLIFFVILPVSVIYLTSNTFISLLVACMLAYLANPLVNLLERLGVPRMPTCILVFILTLILLIAIFGFLLPSIAKEVIDLLKRSPELIANFQTQLEPIVNYLRGLLINFGFSETSVSFIKNDLTFIKDALKSLDTKVLAQISGGFIFSSVFAIIKSSLTFLSFLIITPIAFYYLLYSFNTLKTNLLELFQMKHREKIKYFLTDADKVLSGYFRGMLLLITILSIFYSIAYSLLGLNFGIGLGFFGGLAALIPYLGTFLHAILLAGIVLYQFGVDWTVIALASFIFIVGQILENFVLTPYLMGKSLGLHPLVVIFIFLIFGTLFGVLGLIIALPISAVIIIIYKHILKWLNGE